MRMLNFKNILLSSTICLFIVSCSKLNQEPTNSLSPDLVFKDITGAQVALNGSYDAMQVLQYYGRNFLVMSEVSGDNVYIARRNSNRFITSYTRIYNTNDADVTGLWNSMYRVILTANNIIGRIDGVDADTDAKNIIKGQALFARALAYFDLTRFFCLPYNQGDGRQLGVPIVLQFDQYATPPRNTLGQVYDRIITDLTTAKTLLANTNITQKYTANKYAVSALLSRVYLYKGDNANTITEATSVMNAGYTLLPIPRLKDFYSTPGSEEDIFTLRFLAAETRGSDDLGYMYLESGYGDVRISPDLIHTFDQANDIRYINFISTFSSGEFQNMKYAEQNGISGLHSPKILRLAEVILNRAEAYVKTRKFSQAIADLNTIRTNRGLNALVTVSDTALLDSILVERRKELMFEGHRFFDLTRNGLSINRNYCNKSTEVNNPNCNIPIAIPISASSAKLVVAPIPQRETDVNKNVVQNPGY